MAGERASRSASALPLVVAVVLVVACGPPISPMPRPSGPTPAAASATVSAPSRATPGTAAPSIVASATTTPSATPRVGGTLRVGLPAAGDNGPITDIYVDPHRWFGPEELVRCCLARTLLSYNGRPTADGGVVLRPDLAESLPDVSADGLTWTFELRDGLRYGPPYDDTTITARDVIRGIERAVTLGEGELFLGPISGVAAFADRRAATISGLEAPDARTLIIRLDEPNADVATAVSLPLSSPIPAGAADGHAENYGEFLVSSGPYMFEGSDSLSKGGVGRPLGTGRAAGTGALVRNPSWDRSVDPLRGAWVDRIELSRAQSVEADRRRLDDGAVDIAGYTLSFEALRSMRRDPARRDQVTVATYPGVFFLPMNLALPPFDDVAVRRAVALAVNRSEVADIMSMTSARFASHRPARHAVPDSFENNLLLDYDPFPTTDDQGDIQAAGAAMAESRYDTDQDGRCDAAVCERVPLVVGAADDRIVSSIGDRLRQVGVTLERRKDDADPYDVRAQNGVFELAGWLSDTPTLGGFTTVFGPPVEQPDGAVFSLSGSLVGSTPDQLKSWGYSVKSVPSVDAKVAECLAAIGVERFMCASELDQLAVERVIPFVPIAFPEVGFAFGDRIAEYSIDQSAVAPALDQIVLRP
jgi:peptide/nickel transport system substrate-binding protein